MFKILPRNGRIAWYSRSRACFADPPAESPSTKNNSLRLGSSVEQSANLPGKAGPAVTFLRTTFFAERSRACARSIHSSARRSASDVCWFNHRPNASFAAPETSPAASREESRSFVCPENWGSRSLQDKTKQQRSQTSSAVSLTPLGSKLRISQNSRNASAKPERNPLTCVPPCAVGIRLT